SCSCLATRSYRDLPPLPYRTHQPPRSTLFPYDALPISLVRQPIGPQRLGGAPCDVEVGRGEVGGAGRNEWRRHDECGNPHEPSRSEEHTSELQSRVDVVCRLLLRKKKSVVSR